MRSVRVRSGAVLTFTSRLTVASMPPKGCEMLFVLIVQLSPFWHRSLATYLEELGTCNLPRGIGKERRLDANSTSTVCGLDVHISTHRGIVAAQGL